MQPVSVDIAGIATLTRNDRLAVLSSLSPRTIKGLARWFDDGQGLGATPSPEAQAVAADVKKLDALRKQVVKRRTEIKSLRDEITKRGKVSKVPPAPMTAPDTIKGLADALPALNVEVTALRAEAQAVMALPVVTTPAPQPAPATPTAEATKLLNNLRTQVQKRRTEIANLRQLIASKGKQSSVLASPSSQPDTIPGLQTILKSLNPEVEALRVEAAAVTGQAVANNNAELNAANKKIAAMHVQLDKRNAEVTTLRELVKPIPTMATVAPVAISTVDPVYTNSGQDSYLTDLYAGGSSLYPDGMGIDDPYATYEDGGADWSAYPTSGDSIPFDPETDIDPVFGQEEEYGYDDDTEVFGPGDVYEDWYELSDDADYFDGWSLEGLGRLKRTRRGRRLYNTLAKNPAMLSDPQMGSWLSSIFKKVTGTKLSDAIGPIATVVTGAIPGGAAVAPVVGAVVKAVAGGNGDGGTVTNPTTALAPVADDPKLLQALRNQVQKRRDEIAALRRQIAAYGVVTTIPAAPLTAPDTVKGLQDALPALNKEVTALRAEAAIAAKPKTILGMDPKVAAIGGAIAVGALLLAGRKGRR